MVYDDVRVFRFWCGAKVEWSALKCKFQKDLMKVISFSIHIYSILVEKKKI